MGSPPLPVSPPPSPSPPLPSYIKSEHFLISDVTKIFQTDKGTLIKYEKDGLIPQSCRVKKGKIEARAWTIRQLPYIGQHLGFLKMQTGFLSIISIFTLKGGTLKTSIAFQLARILALHGINVCVIGLDAQESISDIIRGAKEEEDKYYDIESEDEEKGIYHVLAENEPLENVVKKTELPTLSYIPETFELSLMDKWLKLQRNQEHIFRNKLIKDLKHKFDLIIFDCNPSWDTIVDNALECSNILISPMTCSADTYRAMRRFNEMVELWMDENENSIFELFKIIPTRKRPTKISSLVEAKYKSNYTQLCSTHSIRDAVIAETSNTTGKSLIEIVNNNNELRKDYQNVLQEIVEDINTIQVLQ